MNTKSSAHAIADKLRETPKLALDRMPVLSSFFEQLANGCVELLRDYCPSPVTAFVNQLETRDSWDLLEAFEDSVAVIFYCPEWDARILVGLERRFIFSLIEGMFGGDGTEAVFEAKRPFSMLEARVARTICDYVANSLEKSFSQFSEITLNHEKTETVLEFTTLGQNSIMMVNAQILFQVLDQGGRLFIFIPQSALYRQRRHLERERQSSSAMADPWWAKKMQSGIALTEVQIEATIEGKPVKLSDIAMFKKGQVLELKGTDKTVLLECQEQRLFKCHLGQSEGNFTVTIDAAINEQEEMISEILLNAGLG